MATPYLPRQLQVLSSKLPSAKSPICILVYDTQGPGPLIEHICGKSGEQEAIVDEIAWFRISNYLMNGDLLAEKITRAAQSVEWIFLHVGASLIPEELFTLMKHVANQQFDTPRFIVIGESLDVMSGQRQLKELFMTIGSLIDLRAPGS